MDALISALAPYALGAVVLWYFYRKSQSQLPAKIEEVKRASGEIVKGLPSVVGSIFRGESAASYVSPEEFARRKRLIDEALAAKKAESGIGGLAAICYGNR